ncbi:MAG: coagulation factor 5/8 type-like protein, partial [Actinobacteria bacterium]|nr:coagulation factor 5/8 type-like protein [Actinomycetota bacterium]
MTRSRKLLLTAVAGALIATPSLSQAATQSAPQRAPLTALSDLSQAVLPAGDAASNLSFDSRAALPKLAPTAAQRQAVARLGDAQVSWNASGTPRMIGVVGGALTGPSSGEPLAIAQRWLDTHRAVFGLSAADVSSLAVVRDHELPEIGATVLSFAQTFAGIESGLGAIMTVVVDRDGRVVSYAGDSVRSTGLSGAFKLTPAQALSGVVKSLVPDLKGFVAKATGEVLGGYQVFGGSVLGATQYVRKIAFPTPSGARAAYAVLAIESIDDAWAIIVDAETGRPLFRKSLVQHAEGTIYENYPGAKKGGKPKVVSFDANEQSPGGYLDPTGMVGLPGITLLGNNADAAKAWTVPLVAADQYNRTISPTGAFDFAFNDAWGTSNGATGSFVEDADAASVNLFYHHNRIHDEYYEFGFTESAGNFQLVNNEAGGTPGLGGDPIIGGAQSGALNLTSAVLALGRNNANMLTLPDGIPGFTNMYLWEFVDDAFEGEARDGDFDSTIIQHEYSHGLSNRYVGGGGLGSLGTGQSGAMGEGWGDWYAMNHLFREGLTRTAVTAPYVGDPDRGIRNWNYAKSPATYGDYGYDMSGPEVHSDGEIWTATLWTLRTAILKSVGGNQRKASDIAEHLVTDAMPLAPPTPTMLDMRDAILKASELRYKAKYTDLIWSAFASRGMGVSASTVDEADTDPVPAFDVPKKSANGTVAFKVVNASAGGPVKGVRILGGL